jgi:hypothetical protein
MDLTQTYLLIAYVLVRRCHNTIYIITVTLSTKVNGLVRNMIFKNTDKC